MASRLGPLGLLNPIADIGGRTVARVRPSLTMGLRSNLARVRPELSGPELDALARRAIGSYARYWVESLRLPSLDAATIDDGFDVEGYRHIVEARAAGVGPIMVLPHLGGWEWAAAWLGRVAHIPVSAVVERLEPDDVFEWFVDLRASYGVNVIPLGDADTTARILRAVADRHVVCLVADRDLAGTGVPVEFFGASTTLPGGPALISRRSGAPILPTAVFFNGSQRICRIAEPIWPDRDLRLRDAVATTTQEVATALEALIDRAPEQWHVLQPNWSSEGR